MGLVIAWRNPLPVQTIQRHAKLTEKASGVIYIVQELIAGAEEEWVDKSVLEVICIGRVETTRSTDHADDKSRKAGAERHEPTEGR